MKTDQEYTSAATSIHKNKVPAIFKKIAWQPHSRNLDWGGGKYDTATEYLKTLNVSNFIYDPFNRTEDHNAMIGEHGSYDTATISNVLNVIKELEIRKNIITKVLDFLKKRGIIYIVVYEGNRSGVGKITKKDSWQNNMKLSAYAEELKEFNPTIKKNIIIIQKED